MSELELLESARRGDTQAFDALVVLHRQRVYGAVLQLLRNSEEAYDVAQDAFVRAWRSLDRFDGKHAFSTWLHRIAVNAALDVCRRNRRRPEVAWDDGVPIDAASRTTPATFPAPGSGIDEAEIRRRIEEALGRLSPDHRAVLVLREIEGWDYREIAKAVGCSPGTVMSRLFHARRKMQTELRDFYEKL